MSRNVLTLTRIKTHKFSSSNNAVEVEKRLTSPSGYAVRCYNVVENNDDSDIVSLFHWFIVENNDDSDIVSQTLVQSTDVDITFIFA